MTQANFKYCLSKESTCKSKSIPYRWHKVLQHGLKFFSKLFDLHRIAFRTRPCNNATRFQVLIKDRSPF